MAAHNFVGCIVACIVGKGLVVERIDQGFERKNLEHLEPVALESLRLQCAIGLLG